MKCKFNYVILLFQVIVYNVIILIIQVVINLFLKLKRIIFYLTVCFFCFLVFSYCLVKNNITYDYEYEKDKVIQNHIYNDDFVVNVKSDNIYGSYDNKSMTYYFSGNNIDISHLDIISPYSTNYIYKKYENNCYKVFVYSSKYYKEFNIVFISIPIINIKTFDNVLNNNGSHSSIELISDDYSFNQKSDIFINLYDLNFAEHNTIYNPLSSIGEIRYRGATSLLFEKKSYKINVNKKTSILGLSDDNDWVLDALYTDKSKIRNKLSSDIWNMINNNQDFNNDLKGDFVEVFFDDEYIGLYVLKNNVDKKIVNIFNNGLLIKVVDHWNDIYINNLLYQNFTINENDGFLNLEIKEYDLDTFKSFISKLSEFYIYNGDLNSIHNSFNIDNYINYKVFLSLIAGVDNVTKNYYYSMENSNSKIYLTPWDLDLTWGLVYSSQTEFYSIDSYQNYSDGFWLNNYIFSNETLEINNLIKDRYWELRKDVITMDTINKYLDNYKDLLINSGAASRDSYRWYKYDVSEEIEKIRTWANNRINFLDQYFKI